MSRTCRGTEPGPRPRLVTALAVTAATAALVVTGWPGAPAALSAPGVPAGPGAPIGRLGVALAPVLLVAAGWVARRLSGPPDAGRLARGVRAGGYAAVCALVLVDARALRSEYARWHGTSWLAGLWAGEAVFLVVMAACVAGVTALTARRSPAGPAALAVGAVAGTAAGLVLVVLPPAGNPLHVPETWLPAVHALGRGAALVLIAPCGIVAGLRAARLASFLLTPYRGSARPLADVQIRQSVAAGLCAGTVAALLVAIAGAGTVSAAHLVTPFPPALPAAGQMPVSLLAFELGLAASAAGYLPVLVVFPFLGAGLGAWGGLLATNPAGRHPGGRGGGGSAGPAPSPPAPAGHREKVLAGA